MLKCKAIGLACVLLCMAFLNCNREGRENGVATPANSPVNANANSTANDGQMFYLDAKTTSVSQPLGRDLRSPEKYKFVEVEVVKVVNPKQHAVAFEMHYDPGNGEKIFLSSFSLYPAENPGKFIVPTSGKLKNEGRLILTLVLPNDIGKDDKLEVSVKEMKLKEE